MDGVISLWTVVIAQLVTKNVPRVGKMNDCGLRRFWNEAIQAAGGGRVTRTSIMPRLASSSFSVPWIRECTTKRALIPEAAGDKYSE